MEKEFMKGGSAYIQGLVGEAVASGRRCAVVSGNWEIDEAIRLPSDFTIILEDCHLRLGDGTHCNVFVNEHNETPEGTTLSGTDRNISIIGRGKAILDGGNMNDVHERVPFKERVAPIWKNNLILFTNVNGFKVSGLRLINQRWWALNFIFCRNGYIGNLDFCADDRWRDAEGNLHHGLSRANYAEVNVKNADGVDLRAGCQNIVIENLTGFTEDDTVALTALTRENADLGSMEGKFKVPRLTTDICNITIRNIRTSAYCTNVRLLNQGDVKLHDIDIDGVYDTSEGSEHMDHGNFAIRIGDKHMYGYRHCTAEETYNISIKNVYGRGKAALAIAGEIGNLTLYGIEPAEGTPMFFDWDEKEAR